MLNRDDLKTQVAQVTTDEANFGGDDAVAVPQNMRRFIYAIKAINEYDGANLLTLRKVENAAAVETIDYVQFATQYETWKDPDELKEDSAPLYIVEGKGDTGDSYLKAVTDNGNAYLTIWYIDAPA
ncbi:hypothetical protein ES703_67260 [subsurface metagenome]